jgi:hypothetical protein
VVYVVYSVYRQSLILNGGMRRGGGKYAEHYLYYLAS